MIPVLYEDNHLLVVEKPVNIPVQADASGDEDLLTLLKQYIKEKYQKPGEAYLGLVHRLDRPVGGVMVFARTSKAAERLSEQFRSQRAHKGYVALTAAPAPYYAALTDHLIKDEKTNTSRVAPEGAPGAKPAQLSYRLAARQGELCLLDVRLGTGRAHQIRVQLSHAGLPLWGDARYNPDSRPGQQIGLWAYALTVEHPTRKEPMRFVSLPKGGAWSGFEGVLQSLSGQVCTLYADDQALVCVKPQGMTCARTDGGENTLQDVLEAQYGPVYPVHRLDANTGGLVLFGRTPEAEAALGGLLARHALKKTYRALVCGKPSPERMDCAAYLTKDAQQGKVSVSARPEGDAKPIRTRYRTLETDGILSLLEVELITGRTHQIRAHLAFLGWPVLGDERYGNWAMNKRYGLSRQALWAAELAFPPIEEGPLKGLSGKTFLSPAPFAICSHFERHS